MPKPEATKRGTRKLSEVARELVLPSDITSTGWPDIDRQCRALGITFEAWQDGIGRAAFAKRADGVYAASVGGVVMSIPRQVGKTYLVGGIAFALCLLVPRTKVIWTAHHSDTANETFDSMSTMARMRKIAPHIRAVRATNGQQRIIFRNGSRIEFGARERGFGRGKQKVSFLVLDEAQILSDSALENIVPSMNRADNPLMFMMGTPPRPQDPGTVFTNKRTRALAGASKDTLFVEISADPDADPDDRKQWAVANPSYPHFTPVEAMLRMRESFGPDGFRREALGVWDADAPDGVFPPSVWTRARATDVGVRITSTPCVALDVRTGLSQSYAIVAAGSTEFDYDLVVVAKHEAGGDAQWSKDYIVRETIAVLESRGLSKVVMDKYGENAPLIPLFEEAGIEVVLLDVGDMRGGAVGISDGIVNRRIKYLQSDALDAAVRHASKRKSGEGFLWKHDGDDITALRAATAAWWAHRNTVDDDYNVLDSFF